MRNDANQHEPAPDDRAAGRVGAIPRPRRPGLSLAKGCALVVLMAGTCWAVAELVSVWLVPPYLAAMALILFPTTTAAPATSSARPSRGGTDEAVGGGRGAGSDSGELSAPTSPPPGGSTTPEATAPGATGDPGSAPSATGTATASPKPKRTRSRSRKTTRPTADPIEVAPATWVEVGPGKFVRVETPSPQAPVAGPHLAVEPASALPFEADLVASVPPDPTTVPEEPASSSGDRDGRATPDLDPIPHLDPETSTLDRTPALAGVTSDDPVAVPEVVAASASDALDREVSPLTAATVDRPDAPEPDLDIPTVDGITPQVGGGEELILEPGPSSGAALTELEPGFQDAADHPSTGAMEPPGCIALDPWAGEVADAFMDPTEWPPDLDDRVDVKPESEVIAVLEAMDQEDDQDHAPIDLASLDREKFPGCGKTVQDVAEVVPAVLDVPPTDGVPRRSWRRLRSLGSMRGGSGRISRGRSLPGRPNRADRSTRRPTDHRPLSRRGVGRPRQITRTSPPRSPPEQRLWG